MYAEHILNNMKPFTDFKYWFTYKGEGIWEVHNTQVAEKLDGSIGNPLYDDQFERVVDSEIEMDIITNTEICTEFAKFKEGRLEYQVYQPLQLMSVDMDINTASDMYESLIAGIALIRAYRKGNNPDECINSIKFCLDWLRSTDFYECPASSIYHESYPGGLLYHSLKVANQMHQLSRLDKFEDVRLEDALLCALVHDWCKIGLYESYFRNVKNESTGQWEKVPSYRRKDPKVPLGHGVASMFLARRFFSLSTDESIAIRWHMGRWNVSRDEVNELQNSNERVPLTLMLQFADQLSITQY